MNRISVCLGLGILICGGTLASLGALREPEPVVRFDRAFYSEPAYPYRMDPSKEYMVPFRISDRPKYPPPDRADHPERPAERDPGEDPGPDDLRPAAPSARTPRLTG